MFKSKKLSKYKKISHGFFNRNGGKSQGIYRSLNCGLGSNDEKRKVNENIKIVKNKINPNAKDIFFVHQFLDDSVAHELEARPVALSLIAVGAAHQPCKQPPMNSPPGSNGWTT
mgnify:CR=1 FL=1